MEVATMQMTPMEMGLVATASKAVPAKRTSTAVMQPKKRNQNLMQ